MFNMSSLTSRSLVAALLLAGCSGVLKQPQLVGDRDGKPLWTVAGQSDNSEAAVKRDVDEVIARHCLSGDQAVVSLVSSPSGITNAFQRWHATYTCTRTYGGAI